MVTKGYGFSVCDIDNSCPADLEPYAKAHDMERKESDQLAWMYCGNYIISAISVAIDHCLNGKKAKSEYIKESLLKDYGENDGLTQEEMDRKEIEKMLIAERQWQQVASINNLPKTIIK